MMQQYREAKERHPEMLLLFRMGDFYELFDEDAEVGARVLGMTLTSRDKTIPMAGFPHHALDIHLRKLLQAGHRVAICDQVEDASQAKGLVVAAKSRASSRPARSPKTTCSTRARPTIWSPCSAGAAAPPSAWPGSNCPRACFRPPTCRRTRLADELRRLAPSECLVAEIARRTRGRSPAPALRKRCRADLTPRPDWTFDPAHRAGPRCFSTSASPRWPASASTTSSPAWPPPARCCCTCRKRSRPSLPTCAGSGPTAERQFLLLDEVTRRSLELTRTLRDERRHGSLLACHRSHGDADGRPPAARLAAGAAGRPRRHRGPPRRRGGVARRTRACAATCASAWARSHDLQRLTARVSTGRASPRDLAAVGRTLAPAAAAQGEGHGRKSRRCCAIWRHGWNCAPTCAKRSTAALVDDPPLSPREGGVIRRGFDAELDELHDIARGGKEWIARFQAEEITPHRHRQPESRLQPGVRLLHRDHAHATPRKSRPTISASRRSRTPSATSRRS